MLAAPKYRGILDQPPPSTEDAMPTKKPKPKQADPAAKAAEIISSIKRKSTVTAGAVSNTALTAYQESQKRAATLEEQRHKVVEGYFRKLRAITDTFIGARKAYQAALYKMLEDIYALYREVEQSEHTGSFYANLRGGLRALGIKVQGNTTDEALIVRFVLTAAEPKTVNVYSTVLAEAMEQEVDAAAFAEWINKTTVTGAIANYRKRARNQETYKQRLERARVLVLRMLDIRETQTLGSFNYPAPLVDKWVHRGTRLVVLVGYATRRFDREHMTADVNVLFPLSPNLDTDVWVINKLAKHIVSQVEIYEKKLEELEEAVWADELFDHLNAVDAEHAEKRTEWWMDRQQAARYEDQKEFLRDREKWKRQREKANGKK